MPIEPIINQSGWPGEKLDSDRLRQLADSVFQREEVRTLASNNIPDDLNLQSVFKIFQTVQTKKLLTRKRLRLLKMYSALT